MFLLTMLSVSHTILCGVRGRINGEMMHWKGYEGSGRSLLKILSMHLIDGNTEGHKNP